MGDKTNRKFSIKERFQSFTYAFAGLKTLFKDEHNARIHLGIAITVIIAGIFFQISAIEWIVVCLLIGLVFALEIMNAAIENLSDFISPEYNDKIKKVKDLMAAAVLIAAITSIIAGFILFIPKFAQMLN